MPENKDTPMMANMMEMNWDRKYTLMTSVNDDINDETTTRMLALPRMTRKGRSARPRRNTRRNFNLPFDENASTSVAAKH